MARCGCRKEAVAFFRKKLRKKLSLPGGVGDNVATAPRSKSLFASFSSEKEVLA
jgi:hypothetical protein